MITPRSARWLLYLQAIVLGALGLAGIALVPDEYLAWAVGATAAATALFACAVLLSAHLHWPRWISLLGELGVLVASVAAVVVVLTDDLAVTVVQVAVSIGGIISAVVALVTVVVLCSAWEHRRVVVVSERAYNPATAYLEQRGAIATAGAAGQAPLAWVDPAAQGFSRSPVGGPGAGPAPGEPAAPAPPEGSTSPNAASWAWPTEAPTQASTPASGTPDEAPPATVPGPAPQGQDTGMLPGSVPPEHPDGAPQYAGFPGASAAHAPPGTGAATPGRSMTGVAPLAPGHDESAHRGRAAIVAVAVIVVVSLGMGAAASAAASYRDEEPRAFRRELIWACTVPDPPEVGDLDSAMSGVLPYAEYGEAVYGRVADRVADLDAPPGYRDGYAQFRLRARVAQEGFAGLSKAIDEGDRALAGLNLRAVALAGRDLGGYGERHDIEACTFSG